MNKLVTAGILLSGVVMSLSSLAGEKEIYDSLSHLVPNSSTAHITPSVIKGVYQIVLGTEVVYMSEDGRYLIDGSVVDLTDMTNLTQQAKSKVVKDLIALQPVSGMIVYPAKGETKHVISVFTDIDCPFCTRLHKEIPALNAKGVEVRNLSYPRAGVGSSSYDKAVSVWCADNRIAALDAAMSKESVVNKTCKNPIIDHLKLTEKLRISGTPAIVLESGDILPGYLPAVDLLIELEKAKLR